MVVADSKFFSNIDPKMKLAFVYGTLKRDFPNYHYWKDCIDKHEATCLGVYRTLQPHPLVIGPYGTPYMLNLPEKGQQVWGELYLITASALARLDELEEVKAGHYERIPTHVIIPCIGQLGTIIAIPVEAYFLHRSYGERMWERCGQVGLDNFSDRLGKEYEKQLECRPHHNFLIDLELFLAGEPCTCSADTRLPSLSHRSDVRYVRLT